MSSLGAWLIGGAAGLLLFATYLNIKQELEIERLQHHVSCLEHPHGESSIAATRINGHFVVTPPAHRTGCP